VGITLLGHAKKFDGGEELTGCERFGADLPEVEILALEGGFRSWGLDPVTDIERFRKEEEVEDEFHAVGHSEDPVYPFPAVGMVIQESHDEGTSRRSVIASREEQLNWQSAYPRVTISVQMSMF
jgi:hypothetical protein